MNFFDVVSFTYFNLSFLLWRMELNLPGSTYHLGQYLYPKMGISNYVSYISHKSCLYSILYSAELSPIKHIVHDVPLNSFPINISTTRIHTFV